MELTGSLFIDSLPLPAAGLFFRRQREEEVGTAIIDKSEGETKDDYQGRPFRCRFCKKKITTAAQMIEMNGRFLHVYANPAGKVFEIGCFAAAPGCVNHGQPTAECTWFPGYSWRFSLCGTCLAHLGWRYQSAIAGSFYGLILGNLVKF